MSNIWVQLTLQESPVLVKDAFWSFIPAKQIPNAHRRDLCQLLLVQKFGQHSLTTLLSLVPFWWGSEIWDTDLALVILRALYLIVGYLQSFVYYSWLWINYLLALTVCQKLCHFLLLLCCIFLFCLVFGFALVYLEVCLWARFRWFLLHKNRRNDGMLWPSHTFILVLILDFALYCLQDVFRCSIIFCEVLNIRWLENILISDGWDVVLGQPFRF